FQKTYPEAKDNFICVLVEPGKMDQAKDEVTELLRRRRHVKSADPDNFGISSADRGDELADETLGGGRSVGNEGWQAEAPALPRFNPARSRARSPADRPS